MMKRHLMLLLLLLVSIHQMNVFLVWMQKLNRYHLTTILPLLLLLLTWLVVVVVVFSMQIKELVLFFSQLVYQQQLY